MSGSANTQPKGTYKLSFYTPPLDLDKIKKAIFATGAGTHGNYQEVCFFTPGVGQFRPVAGSEPVIGAVGKLEEVGEVRCDVSCSSREVAVRAVEALKRCALSSV
jgi:hypothetical protein